MSTKEDFYAFVVRMLKRKAYRREPWPPSLMIDLANLAGIEFSDERNSGSVFTQLCKDGYIRRAGLFPRETSHGSYRPGWIAV